MKAVHWRRKVGIDTRNVDVDVLFDHGLVFPVAVGSPGVMNIMIGFRKSLGTMSKYTTTWTTDSDVGRGER